MNTANKYLNEDLMNINLSNSINWSAFENKTVLITGATGLIGSLIVKAFMYRNKHKNANITVICLVRNKNKANQIFVEYLDDIHLKFWVQDILDPINGDEEVDYIIHGASITSSSEIVSKPVDTIEIAVSGTKNILDFSKNMNQIKGIVYLSSMEVFGSVEETEKKLKEEDLGRVDLSNVRSCYPESKRLCESLCVAYANQYNLQIKIARLAQTFGAGISKEENRVFAQFSKSALSNQDIILHTPGDTIGNYIYTADAIIAILMLLTQGEQGQPYTVVNESSTMSIKDMATLVASEVATPPIQVIIENSTQTKYPPTTKMKLSSSKLQKLGWDPVVSLKESYRRMIYDLKNS